MSKIESANKAPQISNANPPQNGAVTHHHDQLINPVSFSTTNTTPNKPNIPIPLLELDESLIVFSLVVFIVDVNHITPI